MLRIRRDQGFNGVCFSTNDKTDPRTNGREYRAAQR